MGYNDRFMDLLRKTAKDGCYRCPPGRAANRDVIASEDAGFALRLRNMKVIPFLLALLTTAALAQNLTVSNITVTALSHSTLLLHFDVSAPWNNVRIRYIPTAQGACDSGKGGMVQPSTYLGDTGGNY